MLKDEIFVHSLSKQRIIYHINVYRIYYFKFGDGESHSKALFLCINYFSHSLKIFVNRVSNTSYKNKF